MKVVIKETCIDKYTGEVYEAGQVLEIADSRGKEMLNSKYVEQIKTPAKRGKNKA